MGAVPALGQHTDAILAELGFDADTIAAWRTGRNDLMAIKPAGPDASSRTSRSATSTSIRSAARCTQADNIWFTCLTMNTNPIHFDAEYASQTEFKRPLVNSCFTLALVTGQSVIDLTMNAVANLGWDEVHAAASALRRRHGLLEERSARDARIEVAPERRHRAGEDDRHEPGRRRPSSSSRARS